MLDILEFKRSLRQLVGNGDLGSALQILLDKLPEGTEKSRLANGVKARSSDLKRDILSGIISPDDEKRTFAQLTKAMLLLIDELEAADFAVANTASPTLSKELPAIPDLSGVTYDHCLRPEFTKLIVRTLFEKRQSINLISPPETGSNRLVIDLEKCGVPDTQFLHINMRNYLASHQGMLDDIASQAGLASGSESRLAPLLENISRQLGCRLVLNFRNFERVLHNDGDDLDPLYNVDFINGLNALRNRPDLRLIYKTELPHTHCRFRGRSSWLTLEQITVRDLTDSQITAEVKRQMPDLPAGLRDWLVDLFYTDPKPYFLIYKITEALPGLHEPTREALRDLLKDIKKEAYGNGK